jgi:hypothetical protein
VLILSLRFVLLYTAEMPGIQFLLGVVYVSNGLSKDATKGYVKIL